MTVYIIFIIILILLMSTYEINQLRVNSIIINKPDNNISLIRRKFSISLNFAILLLILLSSLRYDVGWDYMAYYETIAFGRITNIMLNQEYLTIFLINLARNFNIPQIYFIINSIISICLIMSTIKRYSKDYWISFFLFVTFPLFFLNSLSVIRNYTAIAITFYGFKYIENKKLIRYILMVIIASLFHKSAIIALPFYFFKNINFKKSAYFLILMLAPLFSNILNQLILKFVPKYAVYTDLASSQAGTKAIILLVFIGIVSIIFKNQITSKSNASNMYFNSYFIGLCVYLTFYKQGTMGHRLSLYGTIYSLILLPDIINLFKYKQIRIILKFLFYLLCIFMFFYTINIGQKAYIPYTLFYKSI
ncbi:EpsG family protein [Tissierella sp. MB52-C2]|uniref:EpsG family protein n=1 Tax=Tissierella sp. MB52-C2 TaxID=3070999 RepID=UPI00280B3AE7|nr:EpsG family protein [Tissierella sp. MB52-C2]WMM24322.1 EpsG family protein [Tissierella sp. MB52-C2]